LPRLPTTHFFRHAKKIQHLEAVNGDHYLSFFAALQQLAFRLVQTAASDLTTAEAKNQSAERDIMPRRPHDRIF